MFILVTAAYTPSYPRFVRCTIYHDLLTYIIYTAEIAERETMQSYMVNKKPNIGPLNTHNNDLTNYFNRKPSFFVRGPWAYYAKFKLCGCHTRSRPRSNLDLCDSRAGNGTLRLTHAHA